MVNGTGYVFFEWSFRLVEVIESWSWQRAQRCEKTMMSKKNKKK